MANRDRLIASDKEIKLFSKSVSSFLSSNLRKVLGQLERGEIEGARAAQVLGSLQSSMKELGLDAEIEEINKIYAKDLSAIVDRFSDLKTRQQASLKVGPRGGVSEVRRGDIISDVSRPMIQTLITGGFNQAGKLIEQTIGDVREQVALLVLSGRPVRLDDLLTAETEHLEGKLDAEMGTTFAAFHRTVTLTTAEELGFELFEYIGPDDQVTRKFCSDLLERRPAIYSAEEIAAMQNGQDLPVAQFGGGYRCRHIWSPVSEEEARDMGWEPQR
jgi:hypothetical protein